MDMKLMVLSACCKQRIFMYIQLTPFWLKHKPKQLFSVVTFTPDCIHFAFVCIFCAHRVAIRVHRLCAQFANMASDMASGIACVCFILFLLWEPGVVSPVLVRS